MAKTNRISLWIFALFIRVILYRQIEGFQVYHSGSITSSVQDHVCQNDDVIKSIESASEQQCGFLCTVDQACASFFYHPVHQSCVLCRESYWDTKSLESYPGMVYFRPNKVPGIWNDWMSWAACSQSCGGGMRSRNRTCNMNTYGIYTDDCLGGSQEEGNCNTFSCTPLGTTCADWASRGLNETFSADIDPDGAGTAYNPLSVTCDFELVPGQAVTVIHHDQEARTHVDNYEACGSYSVILHYFDLPILGFEAAKLIADLSTHCKQYVKWECFHSDYLDVSDSNRTCTYWTNRNMEISKYLTGTRSAIKFCACGQMGVANITCSGPHGCYCSNNDAVWRYDDGYITEKQDLPIFSFSAGDTGINEEHNEQGYHTIGPLLCW